MSGSRRSARGDRATVWLPGRPLAAVRCAVAGHRWASQPTVEGDVLVFCGRCAEIVRCRFVDQSAVLGLAAAEGDSWLGVTSSSRLAIDLVAALIDSDEPARLRLRRDAAARPGDSIDVLAQLASVLSRMINPRRPLAGLQVVADHVERSVLERELLELSRQEGQQ